MAKGAYIGIDNVARKVKKGYVGEDSVARKIKKAYIGIGGVARPCWGEGKLAYYGTVTGLSLSRTSLTAASNKKYALFVGGHVGGYGAYDTNRVDAYSASLTKTTTTISEATNMDINAATSVGDLAFFASGYIYNHVWAFNSSLTRQDGTLWYARGSVGSASVGNYALFAGGLYSTSTYYGHVDAFDTSMTHSNPTTIGSSARIAGASVGDYALFAGGQDGSGYNPPLTVVYAYNSSLTRSTASSGLRVARYLARGADNGNYAIFAGGCAIGYSGQYLATVDAYNASLTRTTPTALSVAAYNMGGARLGDYAIFGGGQVSAGVHNTVTAYDKSLVRTLLTGLSVARNSVPAASIGDYLLFGGGQTSGSSYDHTSVVEAYTLA